MGYSVKCVFYVLYHMHVNFRASCILINGVIHWERILYYLISIPNVYLHSSMDFRRINTCTCSVYMYMCVVFGTLTEVHVIG